MYGWKPVSKHFFLTFHHRKKTISPAPVYLYKNLTDSFPFCLLEFREFVPQLLKPFVDLWTRAIKIKPQMNGLMWPEIYLRVIVSVYLFGQKFSRKHLFFFCFLCNIFPSALMTYSTPVFDHSMWMSASVVKQFVKIKWNFVLQVWPRIKKLWRKMNKIVEKYVEEWSAREHEKNVEVKMIM